MGKNFIQLVYGTLQGNGIDTNKLSVDEAIKKFNELKKTGLDSKVKQKIDNAQNIEELKEVEIWKEKEKAKLDKISSNFKGDPKLKDRFLDAIGNIQVDDESTEKILNNLHKLDEMTIEKANTTQYNPNKKTFQITEDETNGLIMHELSHSIEHKIFEQTGQWLSDELTKTRQNTASNLKNKVPEVLIKKCEKISSDIQNQIQKDYFENGKLERIVKENLNRKFKGMFDNMSFSMQQKMYENESKKEINKIYQSYSKQNSDYMKWSCVSDVYDAILEGNGQDIDKLLDSHGKSYYAVSNAYQALNKNGPNASSSEILSNFMEMKMGGYQEQLEFLKSNCSEIYNKLESTYKKIGKKMEEI